MKTWTSVVSLGVIAGFAASAVADNDHGRNNNDHDRNNNHKRVFRTQLVGFNEVPAASTQARGSFYAVVNHDGTAFTYWLSYSGFTTNVLQSHIHFGDHHTNGGISVWLCKNPAVEPTTPPTRPADQAVADQTPDCVSPSTSSPISAVISAADVVGPAAQGIAPTEFAEILAAIRAGVAYVNVHTAAMPAGEIRGQLD